jgi:hypothetical protein
MRFTETVQWLMEVTCLVFCFIVVVGVFCQFYATSTSSIRAGSIKKFQMQSISGPCQLLASLLSLQSAWQSYLEHLYTQDGLQSWSTKCP